MTTEKQEELRAKAMLLAAAWDESLPSGERAQLYTKAESAFEGLLGANPNSYVSLVGLGQIRAKRDYEYKEAIALYERATRLKEAEVDVEVWMLLAASFVDGGEFAKAVPCYDKAIALAPDEMMKNHFEQGRRAAQAKSERAAKGELKPKRPTAPPEPKPGLLKRLLRFKR